MAKDKSAMLSRTSKYKKIRESLVMQLQSRGADVECFIDLIEDYMSFWEIEKKLKADIDERGVVYDDFSSVGVKMQKNNPSIKEIVSVNRQMLTILEKLKLSTQDGPGGGDDEL